MEPDHPPGYLMSLVKRKNNTPVPYGIFAGWWLKNGVPWGRPVDVLGMCRMVVSDDLAGTVHRISYPA
jgi:hypothetical protein